MSDLQSKAHDADVQSFVTALVANAALMAIQVAAFVILKSRLSRIYSPRTYLPPPDKRAPELPGGWWRWLPAVLLATPREIITKNGLDAYMFLRFLRLMVWIFGIFTLITWPIMLPTYGAKVHDASDNEGLGQFSWGNVAGDTNRYAAVTILVYLLSFIVFFLLRREMAHFVEMRHMFLISKSHSRLAQARTVLIMSLPEELANEHDLRQFASFVPGGVEKVWIYRDTKNLNEIFQARLDACKRLEKAESSILGTAAKQWRIKSKAHKKAYKRSRKSEDPEKLGSAELIAPEASKAFLDELVPDTKRPKHRTGFLGILGSNVDTVEWCKTEIARLNPLIDEARAGLKEGKPLGTAFVMCKLQIGAHVLAQCVSYHKPLTMIDKGIEVAPRDLVWRNLDDGAYETRARYVTSWIALVILIVAWAFPTAFIGTLSNISGLCVTAPWLAWICKAPTPVPGIISGILPPVLLALFFILLPFILRGLAWYENIPRWSLISVSVYKRYYAFLVVHGFLIVTLTSGIVSAIQDILDRPVAAVETLSTRLPEASTFFLTYIITQGLAGAGTALLQLVPLVIHFIRKWFLGRTPRQAYAVTFIMPSVDFGVVLPRLSLLATIAMVYSLISPIINGLAMVAFACFYLAWKFLLMQVMDQPEEQETGGLYFPLVVNNLFVGLYIKQICLASLFFFQAANSPKTAIPQGVLMILLLLVTLFFQIDLYQSYDPITDYLPMSLATKKMSERYKRHEIPSTNGEVRDDVDLFDRDRLKSVVRRRLKLNARKKSEVRHSEPSTSATPPDKSEANGLARQDSQASKRSSKASSIKSKKSSELDGRPVIAPAAPALDDSDDEDLDDNAFEHPSHYEDQPWIWIPKDELGLSQILVDELKASGVDASDIGATLDNKGIVEVSRNPPDEAWAGGHDN